MPNSRTRVWEYFILILICLLCHIYFAECPVQTAWEPSMLAQWIALHRTVPVQNALQVQITRSSMSSVQVVTSRHGPVPAICRLVVIQPFQQENRHFHLCHVHPTFLTHVSNICSVRKRKTYQKNGWLIWHDALTLWQATVLESGVRFCTWMATALWHFKAQLPFRCKIEPHFQAQLPVKGLRYCSPEAQVLTLLTVLLSYWFVTAQGDKLCFQFVYWLYSFQRKSDCFWPSIYLLQIPVSVFCQSILSAIVCFAHFSEAISFSSRQIK